MNDNGTQLTVLVMTRLWPTEAKPYSGTWVRDQVAALEILGVQCDVVWDIDGGGVLPYLRLRRAMRRRMETKTYDIVHAHYGFTGIVAASQRKVPVVVTFHGTDVLGRSYAKPFRRAFGWVEQRLSRVLARNVARAVVVSPLMRRVLKAPEATIIPMGIDLDRFIQVSKDEARQRLNLDLDAKLVIFVADPDLRLKRFDLACEAMARVQSVLPLARLIAVHHRSHDDVALFMNAADALILTSHTEGSPTVVKEAMACDLPVVSVDVGDVKEQIVGVEPSYVCDANSKSLAEALLNVLRSTQRSNGRDMIERFTVRNAALRVRDVYLDVLRDQLKQERSTALISP